MADVLLVRLLEYGPVGVLAVVVLILAWFGYKAERRLYDTEAVVKQVIEDKEEQDETIKIVRVIKDTYIIISCAVNLTYTLRSLKFIRNFYTVKINFAYTCRIIKYNS